MKAPRILFIAGFGPIVRDDAASRKLYAEDLGIPFKAEPGGYLHTEALQGARSFALWPLSQAAQSSFGRASWPGDIPLSQAWLEFEVDSVETATAALEQRGYRMLVRNKKEPWGQTISRFMSPEGLLTGVTFTPSMRAQPHKRTRAEAKITVQSSQAKPYDETASPALMEIHLTETFTGDIDGESTVRALQVSCSNRTATMVSMQRFRGKLGGRQGTFVLQGSENVENAKITAAWFVVPGSGTGELARLRGDGGFEGNFGKGSDGTLDYWFE